jgi:hypothetical protein
MNSIHHCWLDSDQFILQWALITENGHNQVQVLKRNRVLWAHINEDYPYITLRAQRVEAEG